LYVQADDRGSPPDLRGISGARAIGERHGGAIHAIHAHPNAGVAGDASPGVVQARVPGQAAFLRHLSRVERIPPRQIGLQVWRPFLQCIPQLLQPHHWPPSTQVNQSLPQVNQSVAQNAQHTLSKVIFIRVIR
jgi:hypothetical protein